jgi:hypothetical protein
METKGHVYLRVNENYTATIRDLHGLTDYLMTLDIDKTFGEITEVSNVSRDFLNEVKLAVDYRKKKMNQHLLGQYIDVFRNQAEREAMVVAVSGEYLLIEYVMPKGTTALNLIRDIQNVNTYKPITYKKALSQFKGLDINLLINNPQK